jgi:hypothetical protein
MEVTASARQHLFDTITRQYDPDDAETLKALLMPIDRSDLVTKADLAAFAVSFKTELKTELMTEFRAELHQALYQQTRTYISWMFGLLTVYTAMAGTLVAIAAIVAR